eukprot:12934815-Prorocentrum_lima.AAC.1
MHVGTARPSLQHGGHYGGSPPTAPQLQYAGVAAVSPGLSGARQAAAFLRAFDEDGDAAITPVELEQ